MGLQPYSLLSSIKATPNIILLRVVLRITPAKLGDSNQTSQVKFVFNEPGDLLRPMTVMATDDRLQVSVGGSSIGPVSPGS